MTSKKSADRVWAYRHEAASMRAESIQRDAELLGLQLVRLSQCETDHQTVLRSIQEMLEELLLAQQLTLDFDCSALHEAEEAGQS